MDRGNDSIFRNSSVIVNLWMVLGTGREICRVFVRGNNAHLETHVDNVDKAINHQILTTLFLGREKNK